MPWVEALTVGFCGGFAVGMQITLMIWEKVERSNNETERSDADTTGVDP